MGCPSKINVVRIFLMSSKPLKSARKDLLKDQERERLVLLIDTSPSCACKSIIQFKDSMLQSTTEFQVHYEVSVREAFSQLS